MRVNLDGLEVLDAVVRHGSFAAAAQALHKAQSAVSYQVRQLEAALGVTLFDRSGHRAVLTPEGAAVLDEGRRLLAHARRLEDLVGRFGEGFEPRLRVVVDGALPMAPVVRALRQLGDEEIPTHVRVTMAFLRGVQRRFERQDADLMIVTDLRPEPWLHAEALPDEEVVLVARADHPAVTRGPHDAAGLQGFLELTVHDASDDGSEPDAHDLGGPRVFSLADYHAAREALRLGLGFGWMPRRLVDADLDAGVLAEVPFLGGSRRRVTPLLVWRTDRRLGPAGRRLVELVRERWPRTEERA